MKLVFHCRKILNKIIPTFLKVCLVSTVSCTYKERVWIAVIHNFAEKKCEYIYLGEKNLLTCDLSDVLFCTQLVSWPWKEDDDWLVTWCPLDSVPLVKLPYPLVLDDREDWLWVSMATCFWYRLVRVIKVCLFPTDIFCEMLSSILS